MFRISNFIETFPPSIKSFNNLSLRTGQLIKGKVLSLLPDNKAILTVNGTKLLARLEVPISIGESAWFMVIPSDQGEVRLKWMKDNNKNLNFSEMITRLIKQFNLKNTKINQNLITELIKRQIPINKEIVNSLAQVITDDTSITDVLQATTLLRDRDLPINIDSIRAVHQFSKGEDILQKISHINDELKSVKSLENTQQAIKVSNELLEIFQLDQEPSKREILPRLVKYFQQINLNSLPNEVDLANEQINLTVKQALEQLYNFKEHFSQNTVKKIEETLFHIAGQQLLTISDNNPLHQTIFHIPGFLPYSKESAFIQVTSNTKQNQAINPDDMRLVFIFQLTYLGDVMVQVNIFQKQLSIQVYGNEPLTKEFVKEIEPSIKESLKEYGYYITGISVHAFKQTSNGKCDSSFIDTYKGVDIKI